MIRSRRARPRRAGFTLLELVVVMWAVGIGLAAGTALLVTVVKTDRVGSATADRISVRTELAGRFRADVGRAEAAPDAAGGLAAGESTLLLRLPGGAVVVYHWTDDHLERRETVGGREHVRVVPVGRPGSRGVFLRPPPGGAGVVTLRITEPKSVGPGTVSELTAALGGSLR